MKTCNTCLELKSDSGFSLDKNTKDNLAVKCKECTNARRREIYHQDPELARQKGRVYNAKKPEIVREVNARSRQKNRESIKKCKRHYYQQVKDTPEYIAKTQAYTASRKDEKREYDKIYRSENKETRKVNGLRWVEANKDKTRAIKSSYKARRRVIELQGDSSKDIAAWLSAQALVCYWCGIWTNGHYHIDHYYPLSTGGTHTVDNLVISCPPCNMKKKAKHPEEFKLELIRENRLCV